MTDGTKRQAGSIDIDSLLRTYKANECDDEVVAEFNRLDEVERSLICCYIECGYNYSRMAAVLGASQDLAKERTVAVQNKLISRIIRKRNKEYEQVFE